MTLLIFEDELSPSMQGVLIRDNLLFPPHQIPRWPSCCMLTPCSHHAPGDIRVSKRRLWCACYVDTQSEKVKRVGRAPSVRQGKALPALLAQGWEAGRMAELLERAVLPRMVIMEEQVRDGRLRASLPC